MESLSLFTIIASVAAIILACGLFVFLRSMAQKQKRRESLKLNYAAIRDLMVSCSDSRVSFDLTKENYRERVLLGRGRCSEVQGTHIVLELLEGTITPAQVGLDLQVFFHLGRYEKSYYDFATILRDVYFKQQRTWITIDLPNFVSNNQRRQAVRLQLDKDLLGPWKLFVSHAEPGVLEAPQWNPADNGNVWEKLSLLSPKVIDISASGLLMEVSTTLSEQSDLVQNTRLLFDLSLHGQETPLRLLLAGRIVHIHLKSDPQILQVRIQFQFWAYSNIDDPAWLRVNQREGIAPLNGWILAKVREKKGKM